MLKPSELRSNLRECIEQWFRIDEWGLKLPSEIRDFDNPPSIGRETPISELLKIEHNAGSASNGYGLITQKLGYQVLFRLPNTLTPEEVSINYRRPFEDTVINFCGYLEINPEIIQADTVSTKAKVSTPELKSNDWLLSATIEMIIQYDCGYFHKTRFG